MSTSSKAPLGHFTILYFASASSYTSKDSEFLPAPLPLSKLFGKLEEVYNGIQSKVLGSCLVTVNLEYVDMPENSTSTETIIKEGDEVAIIPPRPSGQSTPVAANAARLPGPPPYQPGQDGSQPIYLPHTPRSAGNSTDPNGGDGGDAGNNAELGDPKRPRACEACRGLKVRCEPDPNNPDGPCKRCAKANRNCVVTVPSRKRQKKTDSRVAELEKKIDALTASLQATKSGSIDHGSENGADHDSNIQVRQNPYEQVTNGGYGSSPFAGPEPRTNSSDWSGYPKVPEFDTKKSSAPPMVMAGQKRKQDYSADPRPAGSTAKKSFDTSVQHRYSPTRQLPEPQPQKLSQSHEYADVVDRGILTADTASSLFTCYVERMAPHMPAVVFPAGTTAADIRKTKPTLFLAILSASSGATYPEIQKVLTKELLSVYADKIICSGEKTLEIVQALLISTLWYVPPEHFEELKFYQMIHIAAVMAIDIGMGKKNKNGKAKSVGMWRDHPWRRTPFPDAESIEARRAWLCCYFLCCNASMGLRRPNLIRWTSYMADCIEVLESSPEAVLSDKLLCQWVRSQHIAEEIGTQFAMDDPTANISIADLKVQYALKGFERDLEKWSDQVPKEVQTPTLKLTEHVVNLYMHEVSLHVDHNVDEFKPPFNPATLQDVGQSTDTLTPAHISALSTCLTSIDGIFETFLKLDVEIIRCLPVANFIRVAYAVVVLIKMYFAAATPNSELGKVINKDNMKVEQYLDGLVDIFRASAAEEKSRPSGKFLIVLVMLKSWFHRQRASSDPSRTANSTSSGRDENDTAGGKSKEPRSRILSEQSKQFNRLQPGPTNTPLQLLSEVATSNPGGQPRQENTNPYAHSTSEWQQSFPTYDPSLVQGYNTVGMGGNVDPSLGAGLEFAMGDGFEQAMGMTLGVGDFGGYFSDNNFFNLMDSNHLIIMCFGTKPKSSEPAVGAAPPTDNENTELPNKRVNVGKPIEPYEKSTIWKHKAPPKNRRHLVAEPYVVCGFLSCVLLYESPTEIEVEERWTLNFVTEKYCADFSDLYMILYDDAGGLRVAAVGTNVAALPVGAILDHFGPRICGTMGSTLLAVGAVLFAFAAELPFDAYIPGYLLLALGGPFIFISSFQLSNTFPQYSGLILALLTGAFDSSSAVFLFYRILYQWSDSTFIPKRFFLAYLIVPAIIFIIQVTLMPPNSYKTVGELVKQAEETDHIPEDQMTESTALLIDERQSVITEITSLLGSKSGGKHLEQEERKNAISGVWGAMHGKTVRQQLLSPWFILITLFTVIQMTRINFFVATIRPQYEYLLSYEKAVEINTFFDIALPLGGILSIPFIGLILDNTSTFLVLSTLVSLATIIGVLGVLPYAWAAYANISLFVLYRPFYYTAVSDYSAKVFGFRTFGTHEVSQSQPLLIKPLNIIYQTTALKISTMTTQSYQPCLPLSKLTHSFPILLHSGPPHSQIHISNISTLLHAGRDAWGATTKAQPVQISISLSLLTPLYSPAHDQNADQLGEGAVNYGTLSKRVLSIAKEGDGDIQAQSLRMLGERVFRGILGGGIDGVMAEGDEGKLLDWKAIKSLRLEIKIPKATLVGEGASLEILAARAGEERYYGQVLRLHGLKIPVVIGLNECEKGAKQMLVVDVEIDGWDYSGDAYNELEQMVFKVPLSSPPRMSLIFFI
ncbi:hypothetical protein B7494_g2656 [Chlorociboria aeruginascens]|nr:hypothetical protein B7494_g2656 [Chlorociboria aeruginascens]